MNASSIAQPSPAAAFARALPSAAGLVAGIYVFFLIFAQFGFLQGLRDSGRPVDEINLTLGLMALAGIASGILATRAVNRFDAREVGALGLVAAAAAGTMAGIVFTPAGVAAPVLLIVALFTGAGLGAATIAAAVLLREFTGGRGLGLHVGIGTGLAYLVCNVPAVFGATPAAKGWIGAAAALAGAMAAWRGRAESNRLETSRYSSLARSPAVALATMGFLALVWFDSAAFAALQDSAASRSAFWSAPHALWTIGIAHAAAAVVAGVLIDRGSLRAVLASALVLLVAGHLGFGGPARPWPAPVYACGVSLYSTALAAFAALGPAHPGLRPAIRAAWVYSVSGWIGSVAGIGLAQQFGRVPTWAAPAAAAVLALALVRLRTIHA